MMAVGWAEDRATLESDPSADPEADPKRGASFCPPFSYASKWQGSDKLTCNCPACDPWDGDHSFPKSLWPVLSSIKQANPRSARYRFVRGQSGPPQHCG